MTSSFIGLFSQGSVASSNNPVLIVPALHTGPRAAKRSEDDVEGLEAKLLLMEGAKVMVTRNLFPRAYKWDDGCYPYLEPLQVQLLIYNRSYCLCTKSQSSFRSPLNNPDSNSSI